MDLACRTDGAIWIVGAPGTWPETPKLVCNGQSTSFWYDKWLGDRALCDTIDFPIPQHLKNGWVCDFNDGNGS